MPKRQRFKIGKKEHYAERDAKGRFTDITNVGKSIAKDKQKKTRKKVKRGYGHLGDLKK